MVVIHHPVEERQVLRGDIVQMLASKDTGKAISSTSKVDDEEVAGRSSSSTEIAATAAAAETSLSSSSSTNSNTNSPSPTTTTLRTKGRNASGRSWKVRPQKRASTLVVSKVNGRTRTWDERQVEKEQRKETLRIQKEMDDAKRQEAVDKKQRRLENETRRQENELKNLTKSGAIQSLNHDRAHRTLKSMNKKQLRSIKKSRINTKTGVVEYVSAYAK